MVTIFVLYLVDDLTTNVFTPARLTLAMGAAQHQATSNVPKPGDAQGSQTQCLPVSLCMTVIYYPMLPKVQPCTTVCAQSSVIVAFVAMCLNDHVALKAMQI